MEAEKSKRKPVVDMNAGLYLICNRFFLPKRANVIGKVSVNNFDLLLVPFRAFHSWHVFPRVAWPTSHVFPLAMVTCFPAFFSAVTIFAPFTDTWKKEHLVFCAWHRYVVFRTRFITL